MGKVEIEVRKLDGSAKRVKLNMPAAEHDGKKVFYATPLFTRCERELRRIGITVEVLDTGEEEATFDLGNVPVKNRKMAMELLTRLMGRSRRQVSHSDHQLTWFDLKQAAGIVTDVKNGVSEAVELQEWADGVMAEARKKEDKVAANAAKKKTAAAKKEEAGKRMAASKSKSAPKGKPVTASLKPSSVEK